MPDQTVLGSRLFQEWITKSLGCEAVPSASTLPWIWVVEALASSNQVDASLLIDLIKRIPGISDGLGKSAKEMLSFGILQNMFIKKFWKTDDTHSGAGSKNQLDPSERCEDVLRKILHEISSSNVKMGGTHMLKWDIQSFLSHKRSTLPQCDLLQLKDMITNSRGPHLSTLKERSGLLTPNQSGNACNGTIGHMGGEQNFKPLVENGNSVACTQDNEKNNGEIFHDRDSIPAKKRKCVSVDNQGRKISEERILLDVNCDVPCASGVTKKCKRSTGSDKDCEHITNCIEDEGCNLENVSQAGDLEGSGSDASLKDISNAELKNSNHAKLSLVQEISHANETERKFHNLLSGEPTNEARVGVDGFHEPELCSDSDEYHEERIDIASKKTMFLSSQSTHSQDSLLTTDLSQINLCMKCNRGGELLVCSSEACPLVVHDSCLGSPPSFEKDGKFYCPFCAYCRSISEYMELKKKASLARKDLASFIGVRIEPPRNFSTRPIGSKRSQTLQEEDLCGKGEAKRSRISLNEANSPQCRANTEEKQRQQTVSSAGDGSLSKYKMISSTNLSAVTLKKDSSSNRDDDQHHNDTLAITVYNVHGLPHGDPRSSNQNEPSCEVEIEKENVPQTVIGLHHQPELPSGTDDVEDSSDEEKGKSQASKYFIRFHNPEKQYAYPAISEWRRKKAPWTIDEEEALKEGVEKCKSIGSRNIPWREILEYGGDRFGKGRTPMDLKDKWRNICKGSPNAARR